MAGENKKCSFFEGHTPTWGDCSTRSVASAPRIMRAIFCVVQLCLDLHVDRQVLWGFSLVTSYSGVIKDRQLFRSKTRAL